MKSYIFQGYEREKEEEEESKNASKQFLVESFT